MNLLEEAKKAYWREGRRKTPAFYGKLRRLLLEKLAESGELDEDDLSWVEQILKDFET